MPRYSVAAVIVEGTGTYAVYDGNDLLTKGRLNAGQFKAIYPMSKPFAKEPILKIDKRVVGTIIATEAKQPGSILLIPPRRDGETLPAWKKRLVKIELESSVEKPKRKTKKKRKKSAKRRVIAEASPPWRDIC